MAFPNTLFPCIPLKTDVSDEEYRLFHTIDINLIKKLIGRLSRDPSDALNVVAFLLWLERNRLSVNAVYKVNAEWPGHLVDMLADQVVALLEWLKNPSLVWEMRGDISLIQKLTSQEVGFGELYRRRLDIFDGKTKILNEMRVRGAFEDMFPGLIENQNGGVGSAAGPAFDPEGVQNNNCHGVGSDEIGRSSFYDPRVMMKRSNIQSGFDQFRISTNIAFGHGPREVMMNNGAGFGMPSGLVGGAGEPKNKNVVEYAVGPVHDPPQLRNYILHNRAEIPFGVRFIHDPRVLRIVNNNGVGCGSSVSGLVDGHREHENMDGFVNGSYMNNGPILPDVVIGPRMGYVATRNMRKSEDHEMGSTSGGGMTRNQGVRSPISEHELSVLLSGLNVTDEETEVHFDDRTIFLTFSKGYPVTESEVWSFFTRKFGNFIREIQFEEVVEGEQPLYARMVARNTSILPLICDVNIRTKYVINGKHVWAKKYVRKNSTPPPRASILGSVPLIHHRTNP